MMPNFEGGGTSHLNVFLKCSGGLEKWVDLQFPQTSRLREEDITAYGVNGNERIRESCTGND